MTSEELAAVSLEGRPVSYSHAVLIATPNGWHLELEDVPVDSCPFIQGECEIAFDTWEGEHYTGIVGASYTSEDPSYVVLTGKGELGCERVTEVEDVGDARTA
jgi:hypothetical protein